MTSSLKPHRKGFTLVELLVVIAIIVTLMAILVPVIGRVQQNAVRLEAKNTLTTLVNSVEGFYQDNSRLPSNNRQAPTQDSEIETTEPAMSVLAGYTIDQQNTKQTVYFSGKEATGGSRNSARNGLWEENNTAELFDPWRKRDNRGYIMLLDYDYSQKMTNPFQNGRQMSRRVVAWSTGKDGNWNRSNPKKGENKDNVYSWF